MGDWCILMVFGQHWSSMAKRKKLYQTLLCPQYLLRRRYSLLFECKQQNARHLLPCVLATHPTGGRKSHSSMVPVRLGGLSSKNKNSYGKFSTAKSSRVNEKREAEDVTFIMNKIFKELVHASCGGSCASSSVDEHMLSATISLFKLT